MSRIIAWTGFVLSLFAVSAHAQLPKYQFTSFAGGGVASSVVFTGIVPGGYKWQSIYYPANFPGMPAGAVKAVYIRVGNNPLGINTVNYEYFTMKIGYTNDSTYPHGNNAYDTFKTGLTTLYGPANFSATGTDSVGRWIKIPVTTGSWTYRTEQKFVVEFAMGPNATATGFDIMETNVGQPGKRRTIGGYRDSIRVFSNTNIGMMDIGFDLVTSGVDGLNNITAFGLFPNPASGGRFNVSLDAAKPLAEATITVSNALGQVVWQQQYAQPGKKLFKEVSLNKPAPGIYFAHIEADGEHITRRVVVE